MPMKNANGRLPAHIELSRSRKRLIKALRGVSNSPQISTSADVATAFSPIAGSNAEIFVAGLLDTHARLIAWQIVSVGSAARLAAKVDDLFGSVMGKDGHQVVFAFNGKGAASPSDLNHAEDILSAAAILGVSVLDVVKVTPHGHQSLKGHLLGLQKSRHALSWASACA